MEKAAVLELFVQRVIIERLIYRRTGVCFFFGIVFVIKTVFILRQHVCECVISHPVPQHIVFEYPFTCAEQFSHATKLKAVFFFQEVSVGALVRKDAYYLFF